jgi:hypothetical protein
MSDPQSDRERWQHRIFEALRPVDRHALFWLGIIEPVDLTAARGNRLEDFPADDLRRWVDEWLSELDPDGEPAQREWTGAALASISGRWAAASRTAGGRRCPPSTSSSS